MTLNANVAGWPFYPAEGDPTPGEWEHRPIEGVAGVTQGARPMTRSGQGHGLYEPVEYLRARTRQFLQNIEPFVATGQIDNATHEQSKPSNPKDTAAHSRPVMTPPLAPLIDATLKHFEGMLKYGANNWTIVGVRSSVYVGAALRHIFKWWCGEEYELIEDPETGEMLEGVHHIGGAIASLNIVRDAQSRKKLTDDRPPAVPNQAEIWAYAERTMKNLTRAFGHNKPRHYTIEDTECPPSK